MNPSPDSDRKTAHPDHLMQQARDLDPASLERLMSRCLDHECTTDEYALLQARLAADASAQHEFDAMKSLHRLVNQALHVEMSRGVSHARLQRRWQALRFTGIAAASLLFAFLWQLPRTTPTSNPLSDASQASLISSSAPLAPQSRITDFPPISVSRPTDLFVPSDVDHVGQSRAQLQHTDRQWLVVPSDQQNEVFVIQIDRVTRAAVSLEGEL